MELKTYYVNGCTWLGNSFSLLGVLVIIIWGSATPLCWRGGRIQHSGHCEEWVAHQGATSICSKPPEQKALTSKYKKVPFEFQWPRFSLQVPAGVEAIDFHHFHWIAIPIAIATVLMLDQNIPPPPFFLSFSLGEDSLERNEPINLKELQQSWTLKKTW